ncbi:NfeD family protein [Aquisphaera insulae]|uniref:NfeD family protein n=1 Tax=Aquisphaera insulae TaxID=2712864 RepID=UPI0013EC8F62|nr:NfeD family protein [Aquisphaera insulae]
MGVVFWPLVFLVCGLLLILLEFLIPSGGVIGICSLACLALCLWYAFSSSLGLGAAFILVDLVAIPVTVSLAFSLWSRTPLGRRFFLRPPTREEIEDTTAEARLDGLIDRQGRVLTPLRPCGHVEVDGRRLDALAEEGFLPAGTSVRIVRVRSGQVVVRGVVEPEAIAWKEWRRPGDEGAGPEVRDVSGPIPTSPTTADAVSILEESP